MRHLILVPGHAIPYRFDDVHRDEGWYLKPYQAGEATFYLEHIHRGVELAAADSSSVLIFAGAQTEAAAGPRSEGQGYWLAADHLGWMGHGDVKSRAHTEEFSLDSLQNLLFSLCRFRELTGTYPVQVTAVGWAFKAERFDLHRNALRFPASRFRYDGVNNPPTLAHILDSEQHWREIFNRDPYGSSPEPRSKRARRNPFHRHHGYVQSCPELASLLTHEGPDIYPGSLPWD